MDRHRTTGSAPVRYRAPEADDAADHIECTGSSCRSCTAVIIADCIAIGCCPCAVVNMLALTLVKAPWQVSRKCLGKLKKGGCSLRRRVRVDDGGMEKVGAIMGRGNEAKGLEIMKRREGDDDVGVLGMAAATTTSTATDGEGDRTSSSGRRSLCSKLEVEKVWMELYQRDHWGFGRVSFSGNLKDGHLGRMPSVSSQSASANVADDALGNND